MPLVRVTTKPDHSGLLLAFGQVLSELVPAALNSDMGRLTPGSIVYIGSSETNYGTDSFLTVDAFIEIESYDYQDRKANIDERCEHIRKAMEQLFPGYTFAVWGKLVTAGWSREASDPDFEGDMSMGAAIVRAETHLGMFRGAGDG